MSLLRRIAGRRRQLDRPRRELLEALREATDALTALLEDIALARGAWRFVGGRLLLLRRSDVRRRRLRRLVVRDGPCRFRRPRPLRSSLGGGRGGRGPPPRGGPPPG